MTRHVYRVESYKGGGYFITKTVDDGTVPTASVVERIPDRNEANANAIARADADRRAGIDAQVYQALA